MFLAHRLRLIITIPYRLNIAGKARGDRRNSRQFYTLVSFFYLFQDLIQQTI